MAQEEIDAVPAGYVGDLVGIDEHSGSAVLHCSLSELERVQQTTLYVEVRINKPRYDVLPFNVKSLQGLRRRRRGCNAVDKPRL